MRVVLVHGFTQTGRSWARVAEGLGARGHEVVCPDLPGHGTSADVRADLVGSAAHLARLVGRGGIWVGYSLGGRVCLNLEPGVAEGLVLVSTTAGIDDAAEREARREQDEALAKDVEARGVEAFVDDWLRGPMWATLPRDRAGIEHRLTNPPAGLAASLRLSGTGMQHPTWDRLKEIAIPVLVLTGADDAKFTALGRRLADAVGPNAAHLELPGGHALPWEHPERFVETVDAWIKRWREPSRR